jgi:hypothetical protein
MSLNLVSNGESNLSVLLQEAYGSFIEEIVREGINCFESNVRKTPPTC